MEKISYKLPVFEGPLDLLLHLISKNKLNIYDIPVSELLDQYVEHINAMKETNMEVASEFLEMAARRVYIKSVTLLPKHEEAEILKQELTGQLLEYQAAKQAAQRLGERVNFDVFATKPTKIEPDKRYRGNHDPQVLLDAYVQAAGRGKRKLPPPVTAFQGIVSRKIVSVASKIIFVLRRLVRGENVRFQSLLDQSKSKSELVATFLAVLELAKGKRVRIDGEQENINITLLGGGKKRGAE